VTCSKPGLRMAGGGGTTVFGVIEGQALGDFKNFLNDARECAWPKILGHGNPIGGTHL
jgi:hypothetical protein